MTVERALRLIAGAFVTLSEHGVSCGLIKGPIPTRQCESSLIAQMPILAG